MVSAVKVDGVKLYELARKGKVVERKARPVSIRSVEVLDVAWPRVRFRVECGGGTYVRSLCRTLGERLGTGGCMESLRRLKAGPFGLEEALGWDAFEAAVKGGKGFLQPPSRLVAHLPQVTLTGAQAADVLHGRESDPPAGLPAGWVVLLNPAGRVAAMALAEGGRLRPKKVFGEEGI
jgi:tRNA pseudouridine55 synthase